MANRKLKLNSTNSDIIELDDVNIGFNAGDTYSLTNMVLAGSLVSATATNYRVRFSVPLSKPINASNVTIRNLALSMYYRNGTLQAQTTIINNGTIANNFSIIAEVKNNSIYIDITNSNATVTQTGFSPVSVNLTSLGVTFS